MIPNKLKLGDEIRVIAPSGSICRIEKELIESSKIKLENLGYKVTFGKNVYSMNSFDSSSVEERVNDLHEAFLDENVKLILSAIGGCNSNQILSYINFNIIQENPKILCGYSDITILLNAINTKTKLVTYMGPNYVNFAVKYGLNYTLDNFLKIIAKNEIIEIEDSDKYSDDKWYINQENRHFIQNNGRFIINDGNAYGKIIGGNLCTLQLLQGTEYFPNLENVILCIEDDDLAGKNFIYEFDRNLQSLIHQKNFCKVKGILIGRNQIGSFVDNDLLIEVIKSKRELDNIPVIANLDFGHTQPFFTIPIGGFCEIIKGEIKICDYDFKVGGKEI